MNTIKHAGEKQTLFKRLFSDNSYSWLAALCAAGITLVIAYCFKMLPFGDITILRMDMYHQYCPLFAELYDRVTGLQSFMYSWQTGLGSSFIGNFYNYLSSPSAIFVLLFGHENVPEAIAAMIFSKAAFSSAAFTYYLKKSLGKSSFATAAFGILYCMCGWFIAYYWDVMWVDAMVFFPFVALGIERIINTRNPLTYIIALLLTLVTNYFMGYMVCIFSVIYFLVYYFSKYDLSTLSDNAFYWKNEKGAKQYTLGERIKSSVFLKSGFTFAAGSLAAAALAAFALVPVYFILQNCYATSDDFPTTWTSYFTIFDFFANHLASLEPTIRSSGDVVLPNVYCGIASFMLVPLYLFTKSIPVKEKVANVAALAVMFASFNYNIISFIWHGFHYPSDLPYRFSFMYSFLLLVMAFKAFTRLKEFSGRQILATGVALTAFIVITQKLGSANVEDLTVILSIIFTVTYTIVFNITRDKKYQESAVAVLLLCCVIGEMVCCNTQHYDIDQSKTSYAGDYDEFTQLKSMLDERDDSEFYRMELTYNRARMDPSWYGYNGVSTFTSMAYESLSKLEKSLGLAGNNVDSYTYYLQTPVYNLMHSLKYIVDNNTDVTVENDYYTELDTVGKFTAFENNYYLPIAFSVNKDVAEWFTDSGEPFSTQAQWFELATGVADVFERMTIDDITYYNVDEITSGLTNGNMYYNKTANGEEGEVTFYLGTETTQHCYLYVASSSFESIQINRNDHTVTQNIDHPYIYDLGIMEPEDTATVLITIDSTHDYGSIEFQPFAVNAEAFAEGYTKLSENTMNVEAFEDTHIKGSITVPTDGMIYTSVPYDEGWTVKLNGKKVAEKDIVALGDGFLCINAKPGSYTVELSFRAKGLLEGCAVSLFTLIFVIAFYFIYKSKKKKAALRKVQLEERFRAELAAEQENQDELDAVTEEPIEANSDIFFADYSAQPEEKDADNGSENSGNKDE